MRNPGIISQLPDGRRVIIYNDQPIAGKMILTLADENNNPILKENGSAKILIKSIAEFNDEMKNAPTIGYVD